MENKQVFKWFTVLANDVIVPFVVVDCTLTQSENKKKLMHNLGSINNDG
jgi:hypothetical protein